MSRRKWVVLALAVLGAGSVWFSPAALRHLRFFEVRRVEVQGARYVEPEAVVGALGLGPGSSVFEDRGELARRVRSMGGLEEVRVGRRLPGTLRVTIRESEPVALAQGPGGLVPVGRDGRPLPFHPTGAAVDAPIVEKAERRLVEALGVVRASDLALYAEVSAARLADGEVQLDVGEGMIRLDLPVDPARVRSVALVRRDLDARQLGWLELDARFRGWIVVRRAVPGTRSGGDG